jgi:hypothetical protein
MVAAAETGGKLRESLHQFWSLALPGSALVAHSPFRLNHFPQYR